MENKKNDGGLAFPSEHHENSNEEFSNGMTLRDYFAGQAVIGIARLFNLSVDEIASRAYGVADAMIKERS